MAGLLSEFKNGVIIIFMSGRLDGTNHGLFKTKADELVKRHGSSKMLLDLTGLTYVSSAGFREFFMLGKELSREGGKLAVCHLQPEVKRIFEIAGFDTAYPIYATKDEAVQAMAS
jgi:anti-anti-sigma factor